MMVASIPCHVVQSHVLSAMDPGGFHRLYKECTHNDCAANRHFKMNYLIPAFKCIPVDRLYTDHRYHSLRDDVVIDFITSAPIGELRAFLDKIDHPHLCDPRINYIKLWNTITKRAHMAPTTSGSSNGPLGSAAEILEMFICGCDQCAKDAFNSIIDLDQVDLFELMIKSHAPCMEHVLKMVIMDDKMLLEVLFEELKVNPTLRAIMYDEVEMVMQMPFDSVHMTCIHIQSLSFQLRNYKDKHSKIIAKRLRYFQKLVGCPGFLRAVYDYLEPPPMDAADAAIWVELD